MHTYSRESSLCLIARQTRRIHSSRRYSVLLHLRHRRRSCRRHRAYKRSERCLLAVRRSASPHSHAAKRNRGRLSRARTRTDVSRPRSDRFGSRQQSRRTGDSSAHRRQVGALRAIHSHSKCTLVTISKQASKLLSQEECFVSPGVFA